MAIDGPPPPDTYIIHIEGCMAAIVRRIKAVMPLLLMLALGSGIPDIAGAQGKDLFGAGAAFLGVGASRIGTGDLDDRLAASGYPTFGRSATGINAGAHLVLPGGLTVGAEWHGLIVGEKAHEGREVGIGGGYGTLGIGYMVEMSQRVRVYPRLGLGGGGMGVWFESDSSVGFDDVLVDPRPEELRREPVLSTGSAVIDLGLGAELLPGGWGRGLMLGIRLGYLAAFDTDWQFHDRQVIGGPDANLGGPYIRATIGVGWRR